MGEPMPKTIDGICFRNMVDYAVRNLNLNVQFVNELNVFPVPDGDTGTNMVTTVKKGLMALEKSGDDLPSISRKFAESIAFEARGNSGVILSQFLKGIAEEFYDVNVVDSALLIEALEKGVRYAYASVGKPVEGTMLTVMRDATEAVKKEFSGKENVDDIITSFVDHAKRSLENTPELLSVLKQAGVVDSGGAGVVYLFEGMKKYLDGEPLEKLQFSAEEKAFDYDQFNRFSSFPFGYCTELLLQPLEGRTSFDYDRFRTQLEKLGDSLVVTREKDKVRLHIHTPRPEEVFALCHQYGEFLTCKIENMSVQHSTHTKKVICAPARNEGAFAIVAVASDSHIQKLFLEMGADVVLCCEENASTGDYLEAFEKTNHENILVFPNCSDAILSAVQAKKLYQKAKVIVLNSRSIAECYAALPTVDFEQTDMEILEDELSKIITGVHIVSIAKRNNTIQYHDIQIERNDYYSFSNKELLCVAKTIEKTAALTIDKMMNNRMYEIVTLFYTPAISQEQMELIVENGSQRWPMAEFFCVPISNNSTSLTISFE